MSEELPLTPASPEAPAAALKAAREALGKARPPRATQPPQATETQRAPIRELPEGEALQQVLEALTATRHALTRLEAALLDYAPHRKELPTHD